MSKRKKPVGEGESSEINKLGKDNACHGFPKTLYVEPDLHLVVSVHDQAVAHEHGNRRRHSGSHKPENEQKSHCKQDVNECAA